MTEPPSQTLLPADPKCRHIRASLVRWAEVSEFWREAVLGTLILAAVATDTIISRRLARARAERAQKEALATRVAK